MTDQTIKELYESGLGVCLIAHSVGIDRTTVYDRLKRMGVPLRSFHEAQSARRERVVPLMTEDQIGALYRGASYEDVRLK